MEINSRGTHHSLGRAQDCLPQEVSLNWERDEVRQWQGAVSSRWSAMRRPEVKKND